MPDADAKDPVPEKDTTGEYKKPPPEKVLFTWKAAARPFKRRNKEFWVTIAAMAGIAGVILFLFEGVMPVVLIISIVFLFYILSTVEPEQIDYQVTNRGIKIADKLTRWDELTRYWFGTQFETDIVIFETLKLPGRLEFVINKSEKDKLKKAVDKYLNEEKASPTNFDKLSDWFAKKLPTEKS